MAITTTVDKHYPTPPISQTPHYVIGRLLTPDDLNSDRQAALQRLQYMARAIGWGIADGLWVRASGDRQLVVEMGMGLNRAGHPVILTENAFALSLPPTPVATDDPSNNDASFSPCEATTQVELRNMQDGPYLLTAKPVYRLSQEAVSVKRKTLAGNHDNCESRWREEGIAFRIIYLGNANKPSDPDMNVPEGFPVDTTHAKPAGYSNAEHQALINSQRRNGLAHWVYGTANKPANAFDPFASWEDLAYSGFDKARVKLEADNSLTDCDLPLAVFYWEKSAVQFVDNWSVRRRLAQQSKFYLASRDNKGLEEIFYPGWGQQVSDQLAAEGEARFLQFQDQLEEIRTYSRIRTLNAKTYLNYLPPAGYVPLYQSLQLRQTIARYVSDIFMAGANGIIAAEIDVPPSVVLPNSAAHVTAAQINSLITKLNSIFTTFRDVINNLKLFVGQSPISISAIDDAKVQETQNSHLLQTAWNNRIRVDINAHLNTIESALDELTTAYDKPTENFSLLTTVAGVAISGGTLHIEQFELNTVCLYLLDSIIAQIAASLNSMRDVVTGSYFNTTRSDLYTMLGSNVLTSYPMNDDGVTIEHFFGNFLKRIVLVDRQTMNRMLAGSWRDPALNLDNTEQIDLCLVYEDVISYAAERFKLLINNANSAFTYRNYAVQIWNSGVNTLFEQIIATNGGKTRPPLFGLFTRAVHPTQVMGLVQAPLINNAIELVAVERPTFIENELLERGLVDYRGSVFINREFRLRDE